jgi:hypothetical protein
MVPADVWIADGVYDTERVVDIAQSIDIGRHPGYREVVSTWATGAHPDSAVIVGYAVGEMAAHAAVSWLLCRYTTPWAARAWEVVTITGEGLNVTRNVRVGLAVRF